MRVVLSRKGTDGGIGKVANLIIDNHMIMLPIPFQKDKITYEDLTAINGKNLFELMQKNIKNLDKKNITANTDCHPDPNLSNYFNEKKFMGSIGQVDSAQSHLKKNNIEVDDLFLFFGWFKCENSKKDKHIIFGYLQIGEIITNPQNLSQKERLAYEKKYPWIKKQPHWDIGKYKDSKNNTIYIAKEKCTFDNHLKGWGTFEYNEELELTKKNAVNKSHWDLPKELQGLKITYHSEKSNKQGYFQSAGRGQEFVIEENKNAERWAINLIKKHAKR